MQTLKYFATGLWVDRHLGQWITTILVMINVGLSSVIFASGEARFTKPSFNVLVDYTDGRVWIWGVFIFIAASFMATPIRWVNLVGLWLGMIWHIIWMACFFMSVVNFETAAATPIPVYGGLAMLHAALLTARVIDRSEEV